jgi:hypothetical protein
MYQLYDRKQLERRRHVAAYTAYTRWSWLRNALHHVRRSAAISSWTGWVNAYLPPAKEFRYRFNTELDADVTGPEKPMSWAAWVISGLSGRSPSIQEHQNTPSQLPLNSTNFVKVLAAEFENVKVESLREHNIIITSATISKPQTIYNDMEDLISRASQMANLEILSKMGRSEAAMKISDKAGKSAPLVIEQSSYDFNMQRPSSSMARDDLSGAWVPSRLTSEMLEAKIALTEGTTESINDATRRLVNEVARARSIFDYATLGRTLPSETEDPVIVVPDFGVKGYTFAESLPGTNITRVEEEYVRGLQDAVEDMLLQYGEVHEYMQKRNLYDDIGKDDWQSLRKAAMEFAKTVPHPQASEGKSWWQPVGAILVLADFPDASLIMRAAGRAIGSIWSSECRNVFDPSFRHYDLAARGAALAANGFISSWEEQRRWARCAEDAARPGCWDAEDESDEERDVWDTHEEL